MHYNFNSIIFNDLIATNGTNYHEPTKVEMQDGLTPHTDLVSEEVNSLLYKCSAAVKQIEENGAIQYIPGKIYNEGNVVVCNVVINNSLSSYIFRCKENNVDIAPLRGMVTNNNNDPYVYFTSDKLLSDKWDRVFVKNNVLMDLSLEEFNKSGVETSDIDFTYISLYDYNTLGVDFDINTEFRLIIDRDNNILSAVIGITYEDNKPILNISEVFCTNYSMDSTSSVWNDFSKFKDFALIGCFMIYNKTTNKFDLCICPRNSNYIVPGQKINIKVEEIRGNIKLDLINNNRNGTVLDDTIIKVPFINGASSEFRKAFEIFECFDKMHYEDMFKKGLVFCDNSVNNDLIIYSCLGTSLSGRYGGRFLDFTDRYSASVVKQNYEPNGAVLANKVNSVEYIEPQFNGVFYSYALCGSIVNDPDLNIPEGVFGSTNGEYYNIKDIDKYSRNNGYTTYNKSPGVAADIYPTYFVSFDASRCSTTYSDDIEENFFLKSTKVYRYMYFI